MNKVFLQMCKDAGLNPIPEYRFHDKRKWRIDYYFENTKYVYDDYENQYYDLFSWTHKLALEVEGGVWTQGRHNRATGFIKDIEKYNHLAMQGILLLRVQPKDLCTDNTIKMIKICLGLTS